MKLLAKITLPYPIILESDEEIAITLNSDEYFSDFKITFIEPGNEENKFSTISNATNLIEIEATAKFLNEEHHEAIPDSIYDARYTLKISERKLFFNHVRIKLNSFLAALNMYSRMYWIQPLPLNHVSGCIGTYTQYAFMPSKSIIKSSARYFESIQDSYIDLEDLDKFNLVNASILNTSNKISLTLPSLEYLIYEEKAKLALNTYQFNEMIIYITISIEALMKSITKIYVDEILTENNKDIVLNKLIELGKNNFQEFYLKLIFSYLFGKPMSEKYPELHNNLKRAFKLRNSLMHSGSITKECFKEIGKPEESELTFELCQELYLKFKDANHVIFDEFTRLLNKLAESNELNIITK